MKDTEIVFCNILVSYFCDWFHLEKVLLFLQVKGWLHDKHKFVLIYVKGGRKHVKDSGL